MPAARCCFDLQVRGRAVHHQYVGVIRSLLLQHSDEQFEDFSDRGASGPASVCPRQVHCVWSEVKELPKSPLEQNAFSPKHHLGEVLVQLCIVGDEGHVSQIHTCQVPACTKTSRTRKSAGPPAPHDDAPQRRGH